MPEPLSPDPVSDDADGLLPAYLANGIIGLRVRAMPLRGGIAVLSGLAGEHPVAGIEAAAYAPYPLAADIRLGRVWLSDLPHRVEALEQRYDFGCGELHSRFRFHGDGVTAQVEVLTFCSRTRPTLALQEIQVTVDQPCDLALRAMLDPTGVEGRTVHRDARGMPDSGVDGSLCWETRGGLSTCGLAHVTALLGDGSVTRGQNNSGEQRPLLIEYTLHARAERRYTLRQITSMIPSALHHQPDREAMRRAQAAQALGFEALRRENQAAWQELWRGRINLVGAERRWQALADAAFFYLNSSVHRSSPASTSIFGLAQWPDYHYYYGHVMWDIETFSVPVLLLLQPDAARAILDYRSRVLPAARANAQLNGRAGTQFPWESGPRLGEETAPGAGSASWYEDHVNTDVALGFAQYAQATGDDRFLREQTWPVLRGVADWLASRVEQSPRGYELRRAMGIAEREQPADNVAYFNMSAKVVLAEAMDCARQVGVSSPPVWETIRAALVLPLDAGSGVIRSHDGYRRTEEKGATPDPLAGLFPVGFEVKPRIERATLAYYLKLAPKYIGSPMLSALYGVWAAWTGDRDLSLSLFEDGYGRFITGRFLQTLEYRPDIFPEQTPAGPFFANLSGFLLGCLYGLPGLRLNAADPATWGRRAVVLPAGWKAIEVERVWVRGKQARLIACHGDKRARLEFQESEQRSV